MLTRKKNAKELKFHLQLASSKPLSLEQTKEIRLTSNQ